MKIDRLFSLVAILISVIALFFSWQSNLIATKQITSNVKLLNRSLLTLSVFSTEDPEVNEYGCQSEILISNFGGATDAIIGHEVTYIVNHTNSYDAEQVKQVENRIKFIKSFFINRSEDRHNNAEDNQYMYFDQPVEDILFEGKLVNVVTKKERALDFPHAIPAFSTIPINVITVLIADKDTPVSGLVSFEGQEPNNRIDVVFKFTLASGGTLQSEPAFCFLFWPN